MNLLSTTLPLVVCTTIVFAQDQSSNELIGERTENSSTFLKPNGQKETIISAGVMHYQENGTWYPVETDLTKDTNGRFLNSTNTFKTSFPASVNDPSSIVLTYGNDAIEISSAKEWISLTSAENVPEMSSFGLNGVSGIHAENTLSYSNQNYSDEYIVEKGFLKNNVILKNQFDFLQNSTNDYFGFQEKITLPEGWKIVAAESSQDKFITSGLFILDEKGNKRLSIPAPIIYEKQDPSTDGTSPILGKYYLQQQNTSWRLSTLVPTDWLKDPQRNYPIVIDPTFTAAGADGGWMSAVNWLNNPAFVFVGVCCGNEEHRAWIRYNTTSIDDASCITNVELQLTLNGVGGAAAELTHAYDMTGTPGPYPAISTTVLADMISGWYTSFNLGGVATYGYYDLSAAADAVLQSQLPVNWYQVALVFDNEPSTNWKRFTASACNLRVTYLDPPCILLPVELTSFDIDCSSGNPELKWATASEFNNDHFTIWRSEDGTHFNEIKRISAVGNSQAMNYYSWENEDESAAEAYYKLSQTDTDGNSEFFDVRRFENCSDGLSIFQQESGEFIVMGENIVSVSVNQSNGRVVFSSELPTSTKKCVIPAFEASSGIYFVTIHTSNGEQFIKTIFKK